MQPNIYSILGAIAVVIAVWVAVEFLIYEEEVPWWKGIFYVLWRANVIMGFVLVASLGVAVVLEGIPTQQGRLPWPESPAVLLWSLLSAPGWLIVVVALREACRGLGRARRWWGQVGDLGAAGISSAAAMIR